ncbi:MAG: monovalent cation/H+ antiporter complex subunit F [Acholeplasmataceae bacterium]
MKFLLLITLFMLVVAMFLTFFKLVISKTVWDRILMLNVLSAKVILFIVTLSFYIEQFFLLDIAITYGIIGFLTITLLSKFIMTGGKEK